MPNKTADLERLKLEIEADEARLKDLERAQTRAVAQAEEAEARLRELGFDPDSNLDEQFEQSEKDINGIIRSVQERISEITLLLRGGQP